MKYNIVTNYSINQFIKQRSKYYKVTLGQAITLEDRTGERVLNQNDQFAFVYNHYYKSSLLKQGTIGDIDFYTDHTITEDVVILYIDREEFAHSFDRRSIEETGIDSYLGHILKISEEEYQRMNGSSEESEINQTSNGVGIPNPGAFTYDDLKKLMDKKNSKRI